MKPKDLIGAMLHYGLHPAERIAVDLDTATARMSLTNAVTKGLIVSFEDRGGGVYRILDDVGLTEYTSEQVAAFINGARAESRRNRKEEERVVGRPDIKTNPFGWTFPEGYATAWAGYLADAKAFLMRPGPTLFFGVQMNGLSEEKGSTVLTAANALRWLILNDSEIHMDNNGYIHAHPSQED